MKAIVYTGPLPEIHITPDPSVRITAIRDGAAVNVLDEIADELIARGDFKAASETTP
jgi:hypothetical protein